MNKLKLLQAILLTNVLIANFGLTISSAATIKKQLPQNSISNTNNNFISLGLRDLWTLLRRPKVPAGGRDPKLCVISPQILVDPALSTNINANTPLEIWSLKPLFLWNMKQGNVKRIELFKPGSEKAFWDKEISPGQTSIIYDGEPLQPGQVYSLWLHIPFPVELLSFQIMGEEKRNQIASELQQIEAKSKQQGTMTETIALEKVDLFVKKQMWADALREIYAVPNPSPELKEIQQQIPSFDYCSSSNTPTAMRDYLASNP
ncbi:DUF928 domain-containing protein [Calothrix sp. FACHB-1219]|uniref:DUF928 domain-containing protein n=1 Tax=unclassified Calothrix TaxID=2619626 RepID=UPI001688D8F1|nr:MULTISPECIES: DUF928 domain-containing protein [unclassified Calothrix]MBD2205842.1 DUF928 domain-containing protein [Calothrix sp. FACHB-168]MBD2220671.1 DUF928 domain-containing protein [Calothrix sp. FACHB-1219]